MPNPSGDLGDALESLPPERFAAFVAALWAARGRSVSRDGSRVTVTDADGERVLYARAAGDEGPVPADADVVVSATAFDAETDAGRERIGPADLHELLRFGLPNAEGDRVLAEYVDADLVASPEPDPQRAADEEIESDASDAAPRPVSAEPAGAATGEVDPTEADDRTATDDRARRRPHRRTVLLGAGAFVAGLATAAAGGLGPFGSAGGAPSEATTTPTPTPTPEVAVPGLSLSGVADPQVLARAHLDRLEAASFSLSTIRTVHARDGTLLSSLRLSARVDKSREFVAEIGTAGPAGRDVFGDPPARATLYSDGEQQYRRLSSDGETSYYAVPLGAGVNGWFYWTNVFPFGGLFYASDEYYRDLFDAVPVALTSRAGDGEPPYHLHATDVRVEEPNPQVFASLDDDTSIGNLSLLASVSGAGLVSSLRLSFDGERFTNPATAQISTDYRDLGTTTVDRPDWADRADSG